MLKRPFLVTLLAISVLSLTIWNIVRFGTAIAHWPVLAEFASPPGPLYIALTGFFWTLAGVALTLGLWFGWSWARQAAGPAGAAYVLYYWLDRILYQSNFPRPNWSCSAVISLLWLALFIGVLLTAASQDFFKKRDKR